MTDKMTIEQAIKVLKSLELQLASENFSKALEVAIEALELQMPKKPKVDERCPTCFSLLNVQDRCCGECGQVIDWESDTE